MTYLVLWASGDSTKVSFNSKVERDGFIQRNSFLRRKDGVVKMVLVK